MMPPQPGRQHRAEPLAHLEFRSGRGELLPAGAGSRGWWAANNIAGTGSGADRDHNEHGVKRFHSHFLLHKAGLKRHLRGRTSPNLFVIMNRPLSATAEDMMVH